MPEKMVPMPYQKAGVEWIEYYRNRALLADDMGLGKTPQSLWWLRRNRGPVSLWPAVVVCPAAVKYTWERQARAVIGVRANVLEGRRAKRRLRQAPITIINYDILGGWLDYLRDLNPGSVIMDECHYIMNPEAQRTQNTLQLCEEVPNLLSLSGTAITSRPAELWPTAHLLWPDAFPSRIEYYHRYCRPRRRPWGWEYKGAANLPELHARLISAGMIRRTKDQVLDQLPAKTREVITLPLSDPKEYNRANVDFLGWLAGVSRVAAKKASKAEKLVQLGYLKRLAAKLKFRAAVEWLNNWLHNTGDEKIVVYGVHTKLVEAMHRLYQGRCVSITGDTPAQKRQAIIDEFTHNKKVRILVGNIQAVGTGTDGLQHACRTAAFFELDWIPGRHVQAEDRLHRIGQLWPLSIFYLVSAGTIEEYLCRILQEKAKVLAGVLDGVFDSEPDLALMDQLIEAMSGRGGSQWALAI